MSQLSRCKLTRVRKTVEETVWKDVLTTICRSEDLTVPPLVGCCRWNLTFLLSANIIDSTVLQCLVKSVSFIRLLVVSLVVMEWQTFPGSRHLTRYCADSSSACSFTFRCFSFYVGGQHWISCDSQWQSSEPCSVYIGCFCSLCRVGLYSKQV